MIDFTKDELETIKSSSSLIKGFKEFFSKHDITDKDTIRKLKKKLTLKYKLGYPECVIFVGLQGSGKSTLFKSKYSDTHVRVNLDMLKTRKKELILLEATVAGELNVVIDNTNPTIENRKYYIDMFKDTHIIKFEYIDVDVKIAIERNSKRTKGKVANVVIYVTNNKMVKPTKDELNM